MLWLTRNGDGERNILPSSTPPYSTALPHARDSHRYRVTQRHLLGMKRAQNKSLRPIPVFPTSKHLGLGLYILKGHSLKILWHHLIGSATAPATDSQRIIVTEAARKQNQIERNGCNVPSAIQLDTMVRNYTSLINWQEINQAIMHVKVFVCYV